MARLRAGLVHRRSIGPGLYPARHAPFGCVPDASAPLRPLAAIRALAPHLSLSVAHRRQARSLPAAPVADARSMSGSKTPPSSKTLANAFDRRSFVLGAVGGGMGLLLAGRMAWIAVAENERYELESESNRVNLTLIPPRRGWLLDRNGAPLASNRADFRVDIIPERLTDPDRQLAMLGEIAALRYRRADRSEGSRGRGARIPAGRGRQRAGIRSVRGDQRASARAARRGPRSAAIRDTTPPAPRSVI